MNKKLNDEELNNVSGGDGESNDRKHHWVFVAKDMQGEEHTKVTPVSRNPMSYFLWFPTFVEEMIENKWAFVSETKIYDE